MNGILRTKNWKSILGMERVLQISLHVVNAFQSSATVNEVCLSQLYSLLN